MNFYLGLPMNIFAFFFIELPLAVMKYFFSLNQAFLQLFSMPLIIRTFFSPWKNEYRNQFIPVAMGIGMTIKSAVLLVELIFLLVLLVIELLITVIIMLWPVLTILLLFF